MSYVFNQNCTNKGIFSEGFDSETKKHQKSKHSDFDKNYKPSK